ncbi:GMC family oxidoreductase [Couchioplanes azureus]|uniref:GMC family oxidoreductase n=1 Tax=Couchioplanes caeruleus TaxID=56438 RepID=UPI0016709494|nr:GMC family oxidoreductase [Couchioplanes caeruleus]GGQ48603.1 putative GMC-type oxidoreductase [Couchioplanes caeruleus subsp. azureus]
MTDRLGALAATVLGTDAREGRRIATELARLAVAFPRPVRLGLGAAGGGLDLAARLLSGGSLARLDPQTREAVCIALAARPGGRALLDAVKMPLLLAAAAAGGPGGTAADPVPATAAPPAPEPELTCVAAGDWPRRSRADAVVIGSGAGGAMAARELARAGLSVVVLEEGRRFTAAEFRDRPAADRFVDLYRDGGATFALGNPPVLLPQGRGVGGTTLVNSGTCYRTPERVLRRWRDVHGLALADPARFAPLLDEVERTLRVAPQPLDGLGRNGELVLAGAAALGWKAAPMRRNAPGCAGSCQCVVGCPRNAKNGVHLNALPQACAAGAVVVTGARVERIVTSRGRAVGVRFGGRLIAAPLVVAAAGAVETPRLLARSGLGGHPGTGRGLAVHPAVSLAGRFGEPVTAWRGVLQSVGVEQLHDDGVLIEATAGPPGLVSFVPPGIGRELHAELAAADRLATVGAMIADQPSGRVGARMVRYRLAGTDGDRLRLAIVAIGELLFAAGAEAVLTGLGHRPYAHSVGELRDAVATADTRQLHLAAFHPTGSARMGADPQRAPVDPQGRLRGVRGVWVADAAALPGCPEVNPQLSIMALALAVGRNAAAGPG